MLFARRFDRSISQLASPATRRYYRATRAPSSISNSLLFLMTIVWNCACTKSDSVFVSPDNFVFHDSSCCTCLVTGLAAMLRGLCSLCFNFVPFCANCFHVILCVPLLAANPGRLHCDSCSHLRLSLRFCGSRRT